jgi:hypothetical protein
LCRLSQAVSAETRFATREALSGTEGRDRPLGHPGATACQHLSRLRDIVRQQAEAIMLGHWTKHAEMAAVKRRDDVGTELVRENHVHGVG